MFKQNETLSLQTGWTEQQADGLVDTQIQAQNKVTGAKSASQGKDMGLVSRKHQVLT